MNEALLSVENLTVDFRSAEGPVRAVDGLSFTLGRGEILGLVGESGCGKTITSKAVMGLLGRDICGGRGLSLSGAVRFEGQDLLGLSERSWRAIRGKRISMIFQDPMTSLSPLETIGYQLTSALTNHARLSGAEARARAGTLLERVGLAPAEERLNQYPFELSGGMQQRVMIAQAISCGPALLIADEPTTALDVTIQAQILALLRALQRESGMSVLFITHNLAVVAELCDRVAVMNALPGRGGRIVESGPTGDVLANPQSAATRALLDAIPRGYHGEAAGEDGRAAPPAPYLVSTRELEKSFTVGKRERVAAVDKVTLGVRRGEFLGLLGESGCGKSTLGRLLLRLIEPGAGSVSFAGTDVTSWRGRELARLRRSMQMVFQNPYSSFNPRLRLGSALREVSRFYGLKDGEAKERLDALLERVRLPPSVLTRLPRELSGGQLQRLAIARALIPNPAFLVADEPVSALDISVQAQLLGLFLELRSRLGLTMLFISHDISVVKYLCDRVVVMYLGRLVEEAEVRELFARPCHPYTRALIAASPSLEDGAVWQRPSLLAGDVGAGPLSSRGAGFCGCRFAPRCPLRAPRCLQEEPPLAEAGNGHSWACWETARL